MTVTLPKVEFEEIKAKVKEIEMIVADSLAIQAGGGYHIRNLAIDLNNVLEAISASPSVPAEPEPDGVTAPLEDDSFNIQPVNE